MSTPYLGAVVDCGSQIPAVSSLKDPVHCRSVPECVSIKSLIQVWLYFFHQYRVRNNVSFEGSTGMLMSQRVGCIPWFNEKPFHNEFCVSLG